MATEERTRILVICTGNTCRSQLTEAWFRHLAGDRVLAYSAGTHPAGYVHPFVPRVLAEAGVRQDNARSKHLDKVRHLDFDYVITVCDDAASNCPVFPAPAKRLHWPTLDPTAVKGTGQRRLEAFRRTRDELRKRVETFLAEELAEDRRKEPK